MAQRLSFEERARIEAMQQAGARVAETARRLGRDPSTIHRELKRAGAARVGAPGRCHQGACAAVVSSSCRIRDSGSRLPASAQPNQSRMH